jgi:hypothetical protein
MTIYVYECRVAVPVAGGYAPQATTLRFEGQSSVQARAYFGSFGKLLQDPRIVATKG